MNPLQVLLSSDLTLLCFILVSIVFISYSSFNRSTHKIEQSCERDNQNEIVIKELIELKKLVIDHIELHSNNCANSEFDDVTVKDNNLSANLDIKLLESLLSRNVEHFEDIESYIKKEDNIVFVQFKEYKFSESVKDFKEKYSIPTIKKSAYTVDNIRERYATYKEKLN